MVRAKNARGFRLDLQSFGKQTKNQTKTIIRKIVIDLGSSIVLGTPVKTGVARAGWNTSIGVPDTSFSEGKTDKSGSGVIGEVVAIAARLKPSEVAWFTNAVPYILDLENGTSRQAPSGMVKLNILRVQAVYGGRVVAL